jgi:hypothetical protein
MPLSIELRDQQKDHLCGPYHAARILSAHGVSEVDQDLVALHARTALPEDLVEEVPPGASSWHDYDHELPTVDPQRAGTSPQGLMEAIEELSGGCLSVVPISGRWSPAAVEAVLELDARLIANVRTGRLWGSRPPVAALLAALDGLEVPEPPPADWDVGHFVELAQLVRGRRGSLVAVIDSYPVLGWNGVHLQPPAALAAALERGDGRRGGVLAVVEPSHKAAAKALARRLGLKTEIWNN